MKAFRAAAVTVLLCGTFFATCIATFIATGSARAAAADIDPELPADPGQPGPTGTVRLLAGPEFLRISERLQTTSATTTPVDSTANSRNDAGWRIALQMLSPVDPERSSGWCYGGELDAGRIGWSRGGSGDASGGGESIALRHLNLDALFGYSGRIVGGLHWDATPFAGLGIARWQVRDQDLVIPTTRALYWEAGLRAGLSYTWNFGLSVAVEGRVLGAGTRAWIARENYTGATTTVHDHAKMRGGDVLGGIGWRF